MTPALQTRSLRTRFKGTLGTLYRGIWTGHEIQRFPQGRTARNPKMHTQMTTTTRKWKRVTKVDMKNSNMAEVNIV